MIYNAAKVRRLSTKFQVDTCKTKNVIFIIKWSFYSKTNIVILTCPSDKPTL